jgi:hypothetical protein
MAPRLWKWIEIEFEQRDERLPFFTFTSINKSEKEERRTEREYRVCCMKLHNSFRTAHCEKTVVRKLSEKWEIQSFAPVVFYFRSTVIMQSSQSRLQRKSRPFLMSFVRIRKYQYKGLRHCCCKYQKWVDFIEKMKSKKKKSYSSSFSAAWKYFKRAWQSRLQLITKECRS